MLTSIASVTWVLMFMGYYGLQTQEFASKDTCEAALTWVKIQTGSRAVTCTLK